MNICFLSENKWANVSIDISERNIYNFAIKPEISRIDVELYNPLVYELEGKYAYDFITIAVDGTYKIKGILTNIMLELGICPPNKDGDVRIDY